MDDILLGNSNFPTKEFKDWSYDSEKEENYGTQTYAFTNTPKHIKSIIANIHKSWYALCGCCGANIVYEIEKFNIGTTKPPTSWNISYLDLAKNYNRGICLIVNPPEDQIKQIKGTEVWKIQLGDEVLVGRFRYEH